MQATRLTQILCKQRKCWKATTSDIGGEQTGSRKIERERTIGNEDDTDRIGRELPRGKLLSTLSSPATLFANHAGPCRQALGRMLLHPLGELRRAHPAGLHRDVSEVRCGDGLLAAIRRRGETAEHGDDLDHDRTTPSLR